jgi:hypothetical protein
MRLIHEISCDSVEWFVRLSINESKDVELYAVFILNKVWRNLGLCDCNWGFLNFKCFQYILAICVFFFNTVLRRLDLKDDIALRTDWFAILKSPVVFYGSFFYFVDGFSVDRRGGSFNNLSFLRSSFFYTTLFFKGAATGVIFNVLNLYLWNRLFFWKQYWGDLDWGNRWVNRLARLNWVKFLVGQVIQLLHNVLACLKRYAVSFRSQIFLF